ncbi:quinone-dependent dihydroorotate dehydrogenase [Corynebacterium sp.]|uniref:quinone-dependent dihydroorotate dehydrogenase n=1 Tax=Corynebacterium sp. TaxID=1720 RepID=UPI0026DC259B|nr:quinone-dependent dihydroorotate dehydrogenase [Corynebacterium sp.]MDO5077424.1 quinone-dependent dihydroorotate dehydrogenase [Corynebacterium sp.]
MAHPLRIKAYETALKGMFMLRPERIHHLLTDGLGALQFAHPVNLALRKILPVNDPILSQEVFGVTVPRPLGLAAGFDKNAVAPDVWASIGFGYAELGTVTASPQSGNPTPRLFRLPLDKAILNRMGFNNDGAAAVADNLRRRKTRDVIGINIGKTKVVPASDAVEDYRRSARFLGSLADYLVVNVSSPNTPGLRDLQAVESLRPILVAVQEVTTMPVLVKIAPDLSDEDVDAVADLAVELGLAGIVATNTTISRAGLATPAAEVAAMGDGGISGPPVAARSLEILNRLYERVGDRLVLISVGGIVTPQQAWERITHGATLLQGYTPLIYGGPDWIRDIHLGIADQIRAHGLSNISEAIGSGLGWKD